MKEKNIEEGMTSRVAWESLENWARLEIQDWLQELMVAEVTDVLGRSTTAHLHKVASTPRNWKARSASGRFARF